jgi:hypothetical protein
MEIDCCLKLFVITDCGFLFFSIAVGMEVLFGWKKVLITYCPYRSNTMVPRHCRLVAPTDGEVILETAQMVHLCL